MEDMMKKIQMTVCILCCLCLFACPVWGEEAAGTEESVEFYTFEALENARLVIICENGFTRTYLPEEGSVTCFYLPENAKVESENGTVSPLSQEGLFYDNAQKLGPAGRFLVGPQIPRGGFEVSLAEDVSEGYFLVSNMDYESGKGDEPERIDLTGALVAKIVLEDGQFIELHGCMLQLSEGNG